jgi:glycosyltransferase involved in cell wall biosynthesis
VTFLIDAHHLGMRQTGNETWTRNMLHGLLGRANEGELAVAVSPAGAKELTAIGPMANYVISARSSRRLLVDLPRAIRRSRAAAVLYQYTVPLSRTPAVLAIHDLSFEDPRSSDWLPTLSRTRMRISVSQSARRARMVLVLSEWGRQDLMQRYAIAGDRVLVAGAAVDPELGRLLSQQPRRELRGRFRVLAVGNVVPRKNLSVVATAVGRLVDAGVDAELRIVGQVPASGTTTAGEMQRLLGDRVTMTGYVSMEQLAREYAEADVLAFPSLYEGFGIPVVEAMTAGVPVVASTATCLPEIVGDAGLLAEPDDVDAWTAHLGALVGDSSQRASLIGRGVTRAKAFSWDLSADIALRALRRAAASTG